MNFWLLQTSAGFETRKVLSTLYPKKFRATVSWYSTKKRLLLLNNSFKYYDTLTCNDFSLLNFQILDTGIANAKDWGINLLTEHVNESGINEDGSTWYRESGEDLGENGYRCRWAKMGGQSSDGSSKWKEEVLNLPLRLLLIIHIFY